MENWRIATAIAVVILVSGLGYFAGRSQLSITSTTQTATSMTTLTAPLPYSGPPVGPGPSVFGAEEWNLTIAGYSYPPDSVAFNPSSGEIYLAGPSSNVVTVVDSSTHQVSGTFTIPGTIYVGEIQADSKPDTLLAFAAACLGEPKATAATCPPADIHPRVYELNGTTKSVIREFPVDSGRVTADFATGRIYTMRDCPNPRGPPVNPYYPNCGFLFAYDLASGALLANISLNAPPYSIAINPEKDMVYLVAGLSSEEFLAVNGTTNRVTFETPLSTISTPVLQVDAGSGIVYALATNQSSTFITAINGTDGKILYSSPIGSACTVDSNRYYVNPVAGQIYVSDWNGSLGTGYFLVLNESNGRLVNMLSTLGYAYQGSTFNPQLNEVYLLLSGQLVALPAQMPQTYVNPSILTASNCIDEPM